MRHFESRLQIACVRWFRYQYRRYARCLHAVPNGLFSTVQAGRIAKMEGMLAGVPDLELMVARGGWHGLMIEMKNGKAGTQSEAQKEQQGLLEREGYRYVICRSFDDFEREITNYMGAADKLEPNIYDEIRPS